MSQQGSTRKSDGHHHFRNEVRLCPNHQDKKIEAWHISYIGYRIFLGSRHANCKAFLLKNSITHVLVVGKGLKVEDDLSPEITVKRVDLLDLESVRIEDYLDDLCGFVEEGTRGNNKILVHCLFGMSRSVVVVIDYLHRYKGIGMFNAFYFVATGRPQINLNAGFKRYVIEQAKKENSKIKSEHFNLPGDYWVHPTGIIEMNKNYLKDNKARLEKELGISLESPKDAKRGDIKVDFSTEEGKTMHH